MQIFIFTIGIILGFIISSYFSGHYEGHKKESGLYFIIGQYSIHIHHYLWTFLILVILFYLKIDIAILTGILAGATIQGLTYRDRFIIIYKTKDFENIYQKFTSPHWGTHLRRHARVLVK